MQRKQQRDTSSHSPFAMVGLTCAMWTWWLFQLSYGIIVQISNSSTNNAKGAAASLPFRSGLFHVEREDYNLIWWDRMIYPVLNRNQWIYVFFMREILLRDTNKSKRIKYAINLWSRCPLFLQLRLRTVDRTAKIPGLNRPQYLLRTCPEFIFRDDYMDGSIIRPLRCVGALKSQ